MTEPVKIGDAPNVLNYRYIVIGRSTEKDTHAGHPIHYIFNRRSNEAIGRILWYPAWRRWVAEFAEGAIWSTDCLADVQDAIKRIGTGGPLLAGRE